MRAWGVVALLLASGGCLQGAFTCSEDAQCDLASGPGTCIDGGCAFEDEGCPSGMRWHGSAPGGLAGRCVDEPGGTTSGETTTSTGPVITTLDPDESSSSSSSSSSDASSDTGIPACPGESCGCAAAIEVGYSQSCALRNDGALLCWGRNEDGELGIGSTSEPMPNPTVIALAGDARADRLDAEMQTCIIDTEGGVQCWGGNNLRQTVPSSTTTPIVDPTPLDLPDAVVQLRAGTESSCAITAAGVLLCWGDAEFGELGGGIGAGPGPIAFAGEVGEIADVGVGREHTCVLAEGDVHCWGSNALGQLGAAMPTQSDAPLRVPLSGPARALGVGRHHGCALLDDDAIECWGANDVAQTGTDATTPVQPVPQTVDTSAIADPIAELVVFRDRNCVRTEAGTLHCWGHASNAVYRTDVYAFGDPEPLPQRIGVPDELGEAVVAFDHGHNHMCVLTDHHRVFCWGDHNSGAPGPKPGGDGPRPELDLQCP